MPLFSQKNNIVFDFGTGIMKAVVFAPYQKPEILKFAKSHIGFETLFKSNHFQNDVLADSMRNILKDLQIRNLSDFRKSYFLLSPEYIKEKVLSVKIIRDNPSIKINSQEEEKINKQINQEAQKQVFSKKGMDDAQFLKIRILEMRIDGYTVDCLKGFNGKEVEVSFVYIFSINDYLKKAKSFIESQCAPNPKILFLSDFILDFIKDNGKESSIVIDSGDKITRIYQGVAGKLLKISDLSLGGNKITKDLAMHLNIKEEEARTIKEKFFETGLSENLSGEIKNVLKNAGKIFEIEVKDKIAIDWQKISKVFILGGNNHFIKDFFAPEEINDKICKIDFNNGIEAQKEILLENLYYNILLICNYAKKESI
ncbi:MAG TPA: hypothetical protein PLA41_01675 [Candidatus Pacearchaeota archaeon]|nr:hypothetical protein [Candidatus Pacearchaeota archaeon]HPM08374.1 hypothetical protein [Candidatus Pacearchaeota archaeon]HQI74371.1 hypothetical protein [Candidatus Pacearchaeota archaeon]